MFKEALKLIKKYDRIIIPRHSHPDGDEYASAWMWTTRFMSVIRTRLI